MGIRFVLLGTFAGRTALILVEVDDLGTGGSFPRISWQHFAQKTRSSTLKAFRESKSDPRSCALQLEQ